MLLPVLLALPLVLLLPATIERAPSPKLLDPDVVSIFTARAAAATSAATAAAAEAAKSGGGAAAVEAAAAATTATTDDEDDNGADAESGSCGGDHLPPSRRGRHCGRRGHGIQCLCWLEEAGVVLFLPGAGRREGRGGISGEMGMGCERSRRDGAERRW